ncbi:3'-5' exonuclease [Streptodolium elevatio]|uniref:3'-5' exonuclease n=1 Tax=Streptodolium elevatio TaxID=3157996 RepID=A0ABV3DCC0_9ACTN
MAKRLLDRILVVDIEATCWDGTVPPGETNDIIEIGVTELDVATTERSGRRGILVRPERSTVGAFCTELTTLTQADVEGGATFAEACATLRTEYRSHERVWASWGDYDRQQFERQCRDLGVPYPFGTRHVNVKTLFSLVHALPRELGMAGALAHLGRPLEGTHHRGVDDAWNIAGMLADLLGAGRSTDRK